MLNYLEKRKVYLVYLPLISYWIILLAATSFPSTSLPSVGASDKLMHFAAYFVLGVLLNFTLMFQEKYILLKKRSTLFTFLIVSFYACMDEIHQHFIPGRSMEFYDFVADMLGLVLALIFVLFIVKINRFVTP